MKREPQQAGCDRSELAANIINSTKVGLATYLDIPSDYDILFMQGGGTGEFSATLLNFVGFWVAKKIQALLELGEDEEAIIEELQKAVKDLKVDYLITGSWSLKASQEAVRLLGAEHVNIVADARGENGGKFGVIPEESTWKLSKAPAMVYYCDNETVDGVEFPGFPKSLERTTGSEDEPIVVADMSSNILSRRIAVKNFSLIFFGAQKNLGTTGITVVIIKRSLLPPALATPPPSLMRKLGLPIGPIVFDFATAARSNSLYNTLSIFDVYIAGLVLKRLLNIFPDKVDGQQAVSNRKADIIYAVLDSNPQIYKVVPDTKVRSRMNICFRILDVNPEKTEGIFLSGAIERGLLGLKGHRSVGGIRASNYNSVTLAGAEKLAQYLKDFVVK